MKLNGIFILFWALVIFARWILGNIAVVQCEVPQLVMWSDDTLTSACAGAKVCQQWHTEPTDKCHWDNSGCRRRKRRRKRQRSHITTFQNGEYVYVIVLPRPHWTARIVCVFVFRCVCVRDRVTTYQIHFLSSPYWFYFCFILCSVHKIG